MKEKHRYYWTLERPSSCHFPRFCTILNSKNTCGINGTVVYIALIPRCCVCIHRFHDNPYHHQEGQGVWGGHPPTVHCWCFWTYFSCCYHPGFLCDFVFCILLCAYKVDFVRDYVYCKFETMYTVSNLICWGQRREIWIIFATCYTK